MATVVAPVRPASFRIVAMLALLWNLLGVVMFCLHMMTTPEQLAAMTPAQRQVFEATPSWVNIAFGVAVFGGVLGALGLLMGRRWAVPMLLLSLLGVLVQFIGVYVATPAWALMGASSLSMPLLLVAIALALWWYARRAAARGWLA